MLRRQASNKQSTTSAKQDTAARARRTAMEFITIIFVCLPFPLAGFPSALTSHLAARSKEKRVNTLSLKQP